METTRTAAQQSRPSHVSAPSVVLETVYAGAARIGSIFYDRLPESWRQPVFTYASRVVWVALAAFTTVGVITCMKVASIALGALALLSLQLILISTLRRAENEEVRARLPQTTPPTDSRHAQGSTHLQTAEPAGAVPTEPGALSAGGRTETNPPTADPLADWLGEMNGIAQEYSVSEEESSVVSSQFIRTVTVALNHPRVQRAIVQLAEAVMRFLEHCRTESASIHTGSEGLASAMEPGTSSTLLLGGAAPLLLEYQRDAASVPSPESVGDMILGAPSDLQPPVSQAPALQPNLRVLEPAWQVSSPSLIFLRSDREAVLSNRVREIMDEGEAGNLGALVVARPSSVALTNIRAFFQSVLQNIEDFELRMEIVQIFRALFAPPSSTSGSS